MKRLLAAVLCVLWPATGYSVTCTSTLTAKYREASLEWRNKAYICRDKEIMWQRFVRSKDETIAAQQIALASQPAPEIKTEAPWWVWPVICVTSIAAFSAGALVAKKILD